MAVVRLSLMALAARRALAEATASASPAAPSSAAPQGPDVIEDTIWRLSNGVIVSWAVLIVITGIYCGSLYLVAHMRTIACLTNDTQRFFARPNMIHAAIRKHIIDAPLFRKRHHREFRLSKAIDMGTLPSRAQTIFLVSYIAVIIAYTTAYFDFNKTKSKVYAGMLRRSGAVAVVNMLPLFLLAGRNNPLIKVTGITFDTYNLIHRWLGRIVVAETIVHVVMYSINKVTMKGWAALGTALTTSKFIMPGFIAACAFVVLLLHSPGPIRHAFYETFLITHQLLAAVALGGVWVHVKGFPGDFALIKAVLAVWVIERGIRLIRLIYGNVGRGGSTAEVETLPGDALRVKVKMARPFPFRTGSHAYLYMPGVGWWMSHPFSIAWSDEGEIVTPKSLMMDPEKGYSDDRSAVLSVGEQTISFVIRRRTGFTEKLWRKAERSSDGRFYTKCFIEGPYGHQSLQSYGTVVLFAAGIGITHQVPHVRDLVTGYANGTVAARKITLVWIIQSPEHLEWIRPWMTTILSLPRRRECLKILLFVTRPRSTKEIHSPSSSVQMFPSRPNIQSVIDNEVEQSIGAIGVSVCGTGALADDIRRACRMWMGKVNIDFSEESFSW